MLASGESDDPIVAEQFSETTVVCDEGRGDTEVSSDLDNVDFLV